MQDALERRERLRVEFVGELERRRTTGAGIGRAADRMSPVTGAGSAGNTGGATGATAPSGRSSLFRIGNTLQVPPVRPNMNNRPNGGRNTNRRTAPNTGTTNSNRNALNRSSTTPTTRRTVSNYTATTSNTNRNSRRDQERTI